MVPTEDIAASARPSRRHDLDALRAGAMLLGIVLHAMLSFLDVPWLVRDTQREPALLVVVATIHGFRMPLFFFLSGFFTAMLARTRGMGGLLKHRAKRIGLPFALACVTIMPVTWAVTLGAVWGHAIGPANDTGRDIWTAAAHGDVDAVRAHLADGASPEKPDPITEQSPLGWAAAHDQRATIDALLDAGADPNARYRDNNTALHTAAFFGHSGATERLLDAGADINARNLNGETPLDMLGYDVRTTDFLAGMAGMPVDPNELVAGRGAVRQILLDAGAVSGLDSSIATGGANDGDNDAVAHAVDSATAFPIFQHLWFLWFLIWLIAGYALVAGALGRIRWLRLPTVLVATPLALLWLVPLTMLTQSQMHAGGALPGFGPDLSAGILPVPHVLLHYAIFFGFGAMVFTRPDATRRLGQLWWLMLPLALAVLPLTLAASLHVPLGEELAIIDDNRHAVSVGGEALYTWLIVLGLMGLFERLLHRERPWIRYLSDSSYWLYLAHLALILAGQALLRDVALPALVKLPILIAVVTACLLLSYRVAIRYTWVGRMLNGPRTRPTRPESPQVGDIAAGP